jgi:beta-glucosidase/6-phospho-beta-glucosidase/beta-galactosidase
VPFICCSPLAQYETGYFGGIEPRGEYGRYTCGHNVLLSHAKAVQLYRSKYQASQGGKISVALNIDWYEPLNKDNEAGESWCDARKQLKMKY